MQNISIAVTTSDVTSFTTSSKICLSVLSVEICCCPHGTTRLINANNTRNWASAQLGCIFIACNAHLSLLGEGVLSSEKLLGHCLPYSNSPSPTAPYCDLIATLSPKWCRCLYWCWWHGCCYRFFIGRIYSIIRKNVGGLQPSFPPNGLASKTNAWKAAVCSWMEYLNSIILWMTTPDKRDTWAVDCWCLSSSSIGKAFKQAIWIPRTSHKATIQLIMA